MNREQAVAVIKEIFEQCQAIEGKSLKLLPPEANNALSKTFQLHIEAKDDFVLQACVSAIALKQNLSVRQRSGWLIVYKPYPNEH